MKKVILILSLLYITTISACSLASNEEGTASGSQNVSVFPPGTTTDTPDNLPAPQF